MNKKFEDTLHFKTYFKIYWEELNMREIEAKYFQKHWEKINKRTLRDRIKAWRHKNRIINEYTTKYKFKHSYHWFNPREFRENYDDKKVKYETFVKKIYKNPNWDWNEYIKKEYKYDQQRIKELINLRPDLNPKVILNKVRNWKSDREILDTKKYKKALSNK